MKFLYIQQEILLEICPNSFAQIKSKINFTLPDTAAQRFERVKV